MNDDALRMSAELRDELARNDAPRIKRVDPRDVPLRFHTLKAAGRSGAHAFESVQFDHDDSLAKRIGAGTHALLFGQSVAVFDVPSKKGKGRAPRNGKAWAAFKAQHAGAVILSRKEHDTATRIATNIRNHAKASELLFGPGVSHEETIMWTHNGRDRRSTPDCRLGSEYLVELKTTRCAQPERFCRDAMFMGYHAQLADQSDAIEALTGRRPERVFIVAVENVRPHVVQVLQLTARALDRGRRMVRLWFEQYMQFERSNVWPGYCEATLEFDVPDDDDIGLIFGGSDSDGDEPTTDDGEPF